MHDTVPIEQEAMGEDVIVEMSDLGLPDESESLLPLSLAPALLAWQRSAKSKRCMRWVSRVGIPLLLIILFSLNNSFSLLIMKRLNAPAQRSESESIACLVDAAWSPDSRVIAALGYQSACYHAGAKGVLSVYDTHTRRLVERLHPDEAIVKALDSSEFLPAKHPSLMSPDPIHVTYVHVAWSPDGKLLACTFNTISIYPPVDGVMLMNREGGHMQVLLQQQSATAPFYAEWDLARSRSVPFTPPPSAFSLMPLPPALAYSWGVNDTLVPETLLTHTGVPAAPPPGPVGNPIGDPSFTIWQPGSVDVAAMADSSRLSSWSTALAAWSPDGRYLVDGITLFGLLKPPGQRFPSVYTLILTRMNQVPRLPLRDKALLKVVDTATALAWSPNGHVLAAYHARKSVDLYDCRTGNRLAALALHDRGAASSTAPILLRWSPNGSRLLVSNLVWGMRTLWELQQGVRSEARGGYDFLST
jgi:WD40 repeat protein